MVGALPPLCTYVRQSHHPARSSAPSFRAPPQIRNEAFAAKLFEYLRPALSGIVRPEDGAAPCGLNPDFRFYRYR